MPQSAIQKNLSIPLHTHPEVDYPIEPGWNGLLMGLGLSAIIITALFCVFYLATNP